MSFSVRIEADYGSEILYNKHPLGKLTGGNAVFAFLCGLETLCSGTLQDLDMPLQNVMEWYQSLEKFAGVQLCSNCKTLLDCMWGDGGDTTEYREDDYEFYKHRTSSQMTEAEFQLMIQDADEHWKPITEVVGGVQLLLDVFQRITIRPLEGFFRSEDTVPDFEALYANLKLLSDRGAQVIRLNFS